MHRTSIVLFSVLLAPPLFADAGQHIVPAGSLISCTTAEPKLSSKTTAVGDPVLCKVGFTERYGRSTMPFNSYLEGRFEDYRDPGHFVGKGWMELKFDRMVIEPDTVIPIDARVVDVPGYRVDNQGRILGKGHVARDITLWSIPVLWPLDLLMLPMRGPRPALKEETRMTLKVMDDLAVPNTTEPYTDPYGLRHRSPDAYNDAPPPPNQDQQRGPDMAYGPQDQGPDPNDYNYSAPEPAPAPQPAPYAYGPPPPPAPYAYAPPVMIAPPMVVAPPVFAYGSILIAPRPAWVGGGYGYRYGYAPRAYAPRAYGYGGPRYGGGAYMARGTGGMGYRGSFRGR